MRDAQDSQLIGRHRLGDRVARAKFGTVMQQDRDRQDGGRRRHPEFSFER